MLLSILTKATHFSKFFNQISALKAFDAKCPHRSIVPCGRNHLNSEVVYGNVKYKLSERYDQRSCYSARIHTALSIMI